MKIAVAQINPTIGDLEGNCAKIIDAIKKSRSAGADIVLFPELVLTGYPPEDFLLLPHFINATQRKLDEIIAATDGICAIVGVPRKNPKKTEKFIFDSAAVISNKKLLGYQDKVLLPTYDVFDERRYFEPGDAIKVWDIAGKRVAITVCEDIWQHSGMVESTIYQRDPIIDLLPQKPDIVLNLSASPYSLTKFPRRLIVCQKVAATLQCPVVLCNQVGGNDSLIFDGYSLYVKPEGLVCAAKGFCEDLMIVDTAEDKVTELKRDALKDLYDALVLGVRDYFHKFGFTKACLGLSGGIDSALVACIAAEALGPDNVMALIMPSRYSSEASQQDARVLANRLKIPHQEISIEPAFETYLELLTPHFEGRAPDSTEENLQARIRGMILMAFSNKLGYIVLSTGNKSELAVGFSTLYGDMCGGLMVIGDVSKQQVYALAEWINRKEEIIPLSIIKRAPSAELRPDQKDSDTLPPYDILDHVLEDYIEQHRSSEEIQKHYGYSKDIVDDIIRRIHKAEYKRRQSPPGLRVTEKSFSVGRHFPIVQKWVD